LRRYQKAANRYVERGGRSLLKLSDYLAKKHREPIGARSELRRPPVCAILVV
jgi:hypothetical protein